MCVPPDADVQAEQKLQEEGKLAGSGGRVTVSAGSGGRDVELGHVGVRPPAAGEGLGLRAAAGTAVREHYTSPCLDQRRPACSLAA